MKYPSQAKYLKQLRYNKKLSLKQVAEQTKINLTKVHRLESGKLELKFSEAIKFSKLYQDPMDMFIAHIDV
jgi:transcriptional regulator with XRE-family HTH domain